MIFENSVLRKIFGTLAAATAGRCSKLHSKNVIIDNPQQILVLCDQTKENGVGEACSMRRRKVHTPIW